MGKKGTKRKTKWRALPLGEEAGGSGNEEDLLDEDQSTTSSIAGGQPTANNVKRQSFYYKTADKSYRQTRRFAYDRFRGKEPLVKLESKTFDEEEYTKITTPRQDVLFKKGYFGRKREFSVEEAAPPAGEMDGEEPMMDQIIITNGFVDERGHYLVNGNSYEIYDPYSNTVTVVVGPPPYANGLTQPVLAAVSCQPVPLQPVDWFPPGADWPSQGSAWTPSYPRSPHPDPGPGQGPGTAPAPAPAPPPAPAPDPQLPGLYGQPAYVVPGYAYGEAPLFNGVPVHVSPSTEAQNSEENAVEVKKTRRKSTESVDGERNPEPSPETGDEAKPAEAPEGPATARHISEIAAIPPPPPAAPSPSPPPPPPRQSLDPATGERTPSRQTEARQVAKQSHSTQTNPSEATPRPRAKPPGKESHSTQTPPDVTFQCGKTESKSPEKSNRNLSEVVRCSLAKGGGAEAGPGWRPHGGRHQGNPGKRFPEGSPRKVPQHRATFGEDRRASAEKGDSSPTKVSYAKKAMSGLENGNPKVVNGTSGKVANGGFKSAAPLVNGTSQVIAANGTNRANCAKQTSGCEDKRNGFVKARYGRGKTTNERTIQKYKDAKSEPFDDREEEKKSEETANESRSQSEKSSTVSELSSPTELSSGQNTPPEKLIVQKMEEEINKSFEEKLKKNLSKTEKEQEEEEEEEKREGKGEEKRKGKKKQRGKSEGEKGKEGVRSGRKKKKGGGCGAGAGAEAEAKGKSESENSSEEIPFLSNIRGKEVLFGGWEGMKGEVPEVGPLLNGEKEILASLGLSDDRISYSKLPLHSDLLMMLPAFGWSRPKLKIEDFFAPASYRSDLFTERNITSMRSTKPEEFFASVVDGPVGEKPEKKREPSKKPPKPEEAPPPSAKKSNPKTGCKAAKGAGKKGGRAEGEDEEKRAGAEGKEGKLGIVEAVNTWLQEQGDAGRFAAADGPEDPSGKEEDPVEDSDQKNGASNPIHARCREEDAAGVGDIRGGDGGGGGACIRVANVINDGFVRVSREFPKKWEKKPRRMQRSSSWDAKLSEVNIRKHFKFLTDSASFCQDLISDVRNGLPAGREYATEELCDPRQTVTKYYILSGDGRGRRESDSENEVFDALEYKFLGKEGPEGDGKGPDGNGNASITDSGVHSDVESSEDNASEQHKETACKLQ